MARYLPQAIESVLSQDYPDIEYIVMDGGSTDDTLRILARHGDRLQFISENDRGPSDAVGRGFRRARGDILAWLNADDQLLPGAVRTAVEYLQQHPDIDIGYGEGWWIDNKGEVIRRYPSIAFDARTLEADCFICQPATFMRAAAYRRCELDPTVRLSFDYDLWIRMAKQGLRFGLIPTYLANSRVHSEALSISERRSVFQSSMAVLKRHYGYVPFSWIFGYTAFRLDGRDQFLQPLRPTVLKYLASLPVGLCYNPRRPVRFCGEWIKAPLRAGIRALGNSLSTRGDAKGL
jgi:glycosyltransferase involved in cell wall biosynthesis